MQFRFFSIPARDSASFQDELNAFLRGHRVLSVQRELIQADGTAQWAVCVEYLSAHEGRAYEASQGKAKVDYRELLSEEDFQIFARLRSLRKELAERDSVPVYAVFSNEQIAAMVTNKADSLAALKRIDGVGDARVEKYGEAFLAVLRERQASILADGKEAET